MRQLTIVVPHLVSDPEQESALRALPPALGRAVELGKIVRLAPLEKTTTPEAAFLALDPSDVQVPQGPLTVSALGHNPPSGSVHFHLTLCSADEDGRLQIIDQAPTVVEVSRVFREIDRLATSTLTPLEGEGTDHALVWEGGSLEMSSEPPEGVVGKPLMEHVPVGEAESVLRRFIDDSINILESLEVNHIRREEGMRPLNCLWPWGQGFRPSLPNLPLRRGDIVFVESGSMRMQGLCDLVGYRHGDRARFGTALKTDYRRVLKTATRQRLSLALLHSIEEMQRHGKVDEIVWSLAQLSEKVIEPLMESEEEEQFVLRLVAPGGHASTSGPPERASATGLGLVYDSRQPRSNGLPFDERVLDDPRVPTQRVWEFVHPGLIGAY